MLSLREDKLLTQISFIIEEYLSFLFFSCVNFDSFLLFWENQKYTINWHSQKSNSEVWGIVKKKLKYIKKSTKSAPEVQSPKCANGKRWSTRIYPTKDNRQSELPKAPYK